MSFDLMEAFAITTTRDYFKADFTVLEKQAATVPTDIYNTRICAVPAKVLDSLMECEPCSSRSGIKKWLLCGPCGAQ